jgi:hypothetical protein
VEDGPLLQEQAQFGQFGSEHPPPQHQVTHSVQQGRASLQLRPW